MTVMWRFNPLKPGDTIRNPISQDSFSQDAIEDAAEALVRESVQNSLDAALPGEQVHVRLRVIDRLGTPAKRRIGEFLHGLAPHLGAEGNGLFAPPLVPPHVDDCDRYAVVEDFRTKGLEGDPHQWQPIDGVRNDFFSFFRAEGYSNKEGEDRGRWGVGKTVFPRSSRINCYFGITRRANAGELLLMGRCILKTHKVGDTTRLPDGYWGENVDGLSLPVSDEAALESFGRAFEVTFRGPTETGLSVVVPFLEESITPESLLRAAVRDYFHPILTGALEITVEGSAKSWKLDSGLLEGVASDEKGIVGEDILPLIELARWALTERPEPIVLPGPPGDGAPSWTYVDLPKETIQRGREAIECLGKQAFRVEVTVRPKAKPPELSYLDVYFCTSGDRERLRPTFVRDGLVISNAGGQAVQGRHALVVIDHLPLATLLGDAENIAHTEWNKDRSQFNQKYVYAKSYLGFVRAAPAAILRQLTADDDAREADLLRDILSIEIPRDADLEEEDIGSGGGDEGKRTPPSGIGPERLKRFRLHRGENGFTITSGDPEAPDIAGIQVRVAYDLRGGNPLRSWHPADFDLAREPIRVETHGECEIMLLRDNFLEIAVRGRDFNVRVSGFDSKRDLFVRADALADIEANANA